MISTTTVAANMIGKRLTNGYAMLIAISRSAVLLSLPMSVCPIGTAAKSSNGGWAIAVKRALFEAATTAKRQPRK